MSRRYSPIEPWAGTNSLPKSFDSSMSLLEKIGRLRTLVNEFIKDMNEIDEKFLENNQWVQGVKDWFDAEVNRMEQMMVQTAEERITPVVQANMPIIFAPFQASVEAMLDEQTSAIDSVRESMIGESVAVRNEMVAETKLLLSSESARIMTDVLALVRVLIAEAGGIGGGGNPEDTTPPADVTDFTIDPSDKTNTLQWTNPTDSDFIAVMIRVSTTAAPATTADGDMLFVGNATSYIHTNLLNNVEYHYTIFAMDAVPNYSDGASESSTPTFVPIIHTFEAANVVDATTGFVRLAQGTATFTRYYQNKDIAMVANANGDSAALMYALPLVRGRNYEIETYGGSEASVTGNLRAPGTWAIHAGLTRPLLNPPSTVPSKEDFRIGLASGRETTLKTGSYRTLVSRKPSGIWQGVSGQNWQEGFVWGQQSFEEQQNRATILLIETTLSQFRVTHLKTIGRSILSISPWTNWSDIADMESEGSVYIVIGSTEEFTNGRLLAAANFVVS